MERGDTKLSIATALGVSTRTIYREIKRSCLDGEPYNWHVTQDLADGRRRDPITKVDEETGIRIAHYLGEGLSPEQIAGRGLVKVCFMTIYRWLAKERKLGNKLFRWLRQQGREPRKKAAIPGPRFRGGRSITTRPPEIEDRLTPGDWEADTVEGRKGGKRLVTLVCRATRVSKLMLVPDGKAKTVARAIVQCLGRNPYLVHTITFDNGSEFANFREVEDILGATAYFADPHSP